MKHNKTGRTQKASVPLPVGEKTMHQMFTLPHDQLDPFRPCFNVDDLGPIIRLKYFFNHTPVIPLLGYLHAIIG